MLIQFTADALVGSRAYTAGQRADVSDDVARRHLAAKKAVVPVGPDDEDLDDVNVETASLPPPPESASAEPGKRRSTKAKS
jgi:hypothetical protein